MQLESLQVYVDIWNTVFDLLRLHLFMYMYGNNIHVLCLRKENDK